MIIVRWSKDSSNGLYNRRELNERMMRSNDERRRHRVMVNSDSECSKRLLSLEERRFIPERTSGSIVERASKDDII